MPRISGKVALVTGGGTGIGCACALQLARERAPVALAGRRKKPLLGSGAASPLDGGLTAY